MDAWPSPWLWLWWISFPLMVAGGMYAIGGIGPGVCGLVLAGVGTVVGARFHIRRAMPDSDQAATPTDAHGAPLVLFRRLWLLVMLAVALALLIAIASTGVQVATVVIACGVLVLVGGAVALAVMHKTDGGA